jgi:adenine-specific DNA-methyltransferase
MTPYHSQYWAHSLTLKQTTGRIEALSRSIANARVDLNPHQIDAALFALRSPLSHGAILADEVGLGKTIEAGIAIAQRWAERKRRILLIVPATLRKQWQQELDEKFYLPSLILDSKVTRRLEKEGWKNPFDTSEKIIICSYHFASARMLEISHVPWDCVVIDEAHRLRNVYKASSVLARNVTNGIGRAPKLLLTATPLQNSLMELYGLVSVVDPHVFGDPVSFREQFIRVGDEKTRNIQLRQRLAPICIRTLRKQVTEYVPFTRRVPITQDFHPSDAEHELYELISDYLRRKHLFALPASQRTLITLILRKLLASSSFAIAGTLNRLVNRLEAMNDSHGLIDDDDLEGVDELEDEWTEDADAPSVEVTPVDIKLLREELTQLRDYAFKAASIRVNAKGEALVPALEIAFERAESLGAPRKAVIFTESRRTQQYLFDLLSSKGYADELVMMNGSNNDPVSKEIYLAWLEKHKDHEIITGSRPIDVKAAIVEHFRDQASILIATEAAAEGVNLQFCSLVVNYDLPWNPQRIEQRIGRCHRYGQKHDVVVLNFLNRRNRADLRVFQLLSQKFRLFDGVFGASDEILGALESGVDFEKRVAKVYQDCRTPEEISAAFDSLQADLEEKIQNRMDDVRKSLLENFDEDVRERLRIHKDRTLESLSQRERWLLMLTRAELDGDAVFENHAPRFRYTGCAARQGWYNFDWKAAEQAGHTFYRQGHPLAHHAITNAISRNLHPAKLIFDYSTHGAAISLIAPLVGKKGWMELSKLTIETFETEEFLVLAGQTDDGLNLDQETCERFFLLAARQETIDETPPDLSAVRETLVQQRVKEVEERNMRYYDEEIIKLDGWADDLKQGLEREIKDLDKAIREARRTAALAATLQDKLDAQRQIKALESTRKEKRRALFEAQDEIDERRDKLIADVEKQMERRISLVLLYSFKWAVE